MRHSSEKVAQPFQAVQRPASRDRYDEALAAAGRSIVLETVGPESPVVNESLLGVRLRPPRIADARRLLELLADPEVTRFFVWSPPRSPNEARVYLEGFQRDNLAGLAYHFAVVALPVEAVAGIINLYHLERQPRAGRPSRAELGIWLGKPYWGTGLARLACGLLLDFAFLRLGLEEVTFRVHARNLRARYAFEALGARAAGHTTLHCYRTGRTVEHVLYRLRADERLEPVPPGG